MQTASSPWRGTAVVAVVLTFVVLLALSFWSTSSTSGSSGASPADDQSVSAAPAPLAKESTSRPLGAVESWGYNSHRNIPRMTAIEAAIKSDWKDPSHAEFTLVDYGSDQGYFAITLAQKFPRSHVISIEMGGVGGEIWKKEGSVDVLVIQENMANERDVTNMRICQTKVLPTMFDELNAANVKHRYQLVLSVFHWFALPTRAAFEHAITNLFKNAATTFIELPTIGDRSEAIRKQVGWENFEKWYDGRDDIGVIIADAAKSANLRVRVTKLVSVPWVKWSRDMYRVDVEGFSVRPSDGAKECSARRATYQCATRQRLELCS
jgi:hypothetical protein